MKNASRKVGKRLVSLILVIILLIGLSACGDKKDSQETKADATSGATQGADASGTEADNKESKKAEEGETGDEIVIGGLAPLSGPVAVYGVAADNGAHLALDEINAAGGVLGKKVRYVVYDEKGDVNEALNAYNRLKEDKMVALIGDVTSKPSIAVAERAQEDSIPMITPTGTAAPITLTGDFIFRQCFIDPDQGKMMARYASEKLNVKNVAVISNSADDYSIGLMESFVEEAEKLGLKVVANESYGNDDSDFKTQLTKIAQEQIDALYVPDYYGKNILINNQARELGMNVQILGGDGWDGILTVTSADNPKEADGAIFTNQFAMEDDREVVQNFIKNFQDKYKADPVSFAALGYDAMKVMCAAIEKAGSTDPEAIKKALQETDYEGVTGAVKFDANGDPLKEIIMIKVVDGAYKKVDTVLIER